uniref:Uncharacterized protein n=1 Tax=Romanomermis culicivorax TaxID=13658 RepID=A0A915JAS2_ROMCU
MVKLSELSRVLEEDKANLVRIIIANLNNRMWNNNQVIELFKIFDSDGIKSIKGFAWLEYGHTSLERLIFHYKHVQNLDEIAIKLEWEYYEFQYLKPLSENDDQDENLDDEAYNCFMEIAEKDKRQKHTDKNIVLD